MAAISSAPYMSSWILRKRLSKGGNSSPRSVVAMIQQTLRQSASMPFSTTNMPSFGSTALSSSGMRLRGSAWTSSMNTTQGGTSPSRILKRLTILSDAGPSAKLMTVSSSLLAIALNKSRASRTAVGLDFDERETERLAKQPRQRRLAHAGRSQQGETMVRAAVVLARPQAA